MTCDLVTNRFLELSYEERLLCPHNSTAPMIYIVTLKNNLLPSKYLFPTSEKLVSTSWAISIITLYQINNFFHFMGTSGFLFSWKMTCDLVTNWFLELSYEECLLFPHEPTAPMIYILTFKNNLLPSKYLFPTSGKLVSTSWAIPIITLYQINTFSHFMGTSGFLFLENDVWPSHQPIFRALLWGMFALPTWTYSSNDIYSHHWK